MPLDIELPLLKLRRTKIVATIGPATESAEMITRLVEAGVNVFRLNMSHGEQEGHRLVYQRIREVSAQKGMPVAILADLCGPKIRVGEIENGVMALEDGSKVIVTVRNVTGSHGLIPCQYHQLATDVKPGNKILLDDGLFELRVDATNGQDVNCTVVHGGQLKSRKGINLPGVDVSAPALTEKDRSDAAFAVDLQVDFIALSFVRSGKDVRELRTLLDELGSQAAIIAKIEKPEALADIDNIMEEVDAIMVARGDLGVELDAERVPLVQDRLLSIARAANKPVIVATQMLESMITNPRPTRAEVSDVSHAVQSGTDAIMLSGETAVGRFPLDAVKMMDRIARRTEADQWKHGHFGHMTRVSHSDKAIPMGNAVARATSLLSRDLRVRAIVVICHSGLSVTVVSSARPAAPVIAVSDTGSSCNRMCLVWGVLPELKPLNQEPGQDNPSLACDLALEHGLGRAGQHILLVQGFSTRRSHNEPSVTVLDLPGAL